MIKWPVIGAVVVALALLGGGGRTRVVYRPMTASQAQRAARYARQLAAYRVEVRRDCLPVLRYDRHYRSLALGVAR